MAADSNDLEFLLGKDFLTWLWYKSDSQPSFFSSSAGNNIIITIDKKVTVESGSKENREMSIVSGDASPLAEARFGLLEGKKVTSAVICAEKDGLEFQLALKAEDLSIRGLKIPRTDSSESESQEAMMLEKIYLIEECLEILNTLYLTFIKLRLSNQWEAEKENMKNWILNIK